MNTHLKHITSEHKKEFKGTWPILGRVGVAVVLPPKQSDVMPNANRIVGTEMSLRAGYCSRAQCNALAWVSTNYGYDSVAPFKEHISRLGGRECVQ